jgi:hypothetical protein
VAFCHCRVSRYLINIALRPIQPSQSCGQVLPLHPTQPLFPNLSKKSKAARILAENRSKKDLLENKAAQLSPRSFYS